MGSCNTGCTAWGPIKVEGLGFKVQVLGGLVA